MTISPELRARLLQRERQILVLRALLRVLFAALRATGFSLSERLPAATSKARLLSAIERSIKTVRLGRVLGVLGLSRSRYESWRRRSLVCTLDDAASCPRLVPTRLTAPELAEMHAMVTGLEYRHFSIASLAYHAQRLGRVFASASTWARAIRARGWRRPRHRLYPAKPKVGVRARVPDEYWHIDVTVLRLLDGSRLYIHAVIDNFSRRILAFAMAERLLLSNARAVLEAAARQRTRRRSPPTVISDSGVENVGPLGTSADEGWLCWVLAQVEVAFSNSMIERFFQSLRHRWLYLHDLTDAGTAMRLVERFIADYNGVIPHAALRGRTPDEVYYQQDEELPARLRASGLEARRARQSANRSASCGQCPVDGKSNHIRRVDTANILP